ncbi:MAG: hypothetical protein HKN07_05250 [Acidimicrobiia bacterium]|nr:hypothetical protein [Acidimicrobiia bacterium]NNF63648.1 hypothetical protein [Acidimicrobiia bacterium]
MASITRRDALKRGALIGVGAVWATPVIQSIGMSRAFATVVSDPDATYYAIKIEQGGCEDIYNQTGVPSGGQCLDVDVSVTPISGGCSSIVNLVDVADDNDPTPWKIELADGCYPITIARKSSTDCDVISLDDAWDSGTQTITVEHSSHAISHVEVVICCPA